MRQSIGTWVLAGTLLAALGAACGGESSSPAGGAGGSGAGGSAGSSAGAAGSAGSTSQARVYEPVSPEKRLLRAAMVLVGRRPTAAEYAQVSADPNAFEGLVDGYLQSPAFGAAVRQFFTEWMELDQAPDNYPAGFKALGDLAGMGTHELNTSLIQAAGRLAEHVVVNDRPWSEVVEADYTLADHVVATVWGLPYDKQKGGWQVTQYTDGRPVAGVLSDGFVFTRMPSTEGNRHRERASLIADALICHDYPNRAVKIPPDLDLTSDAAINNAVENNPVCISCHHTLDPLASFFAVHYPLRFPEYETSYPLVEYTPSETAKFMPPAWYGTPAKDLSEMGSLMAKDPRFSACAVRRFYSELLQVELNDIPQMEINRYLPGFKQGGLNVRQLVNAIVLSDEFAAEKHTAGPKALVSVGLRKATPQQLDSMFSDLTGYQWRADVGFDIGSGAVGSVPLMRDFLWGYRTLSGGPNSFDTIRHNRHPDPTSLLALRALSERAARHIVAADGALAADQRRLFTVDGALQGDTAKVQEQLIALNLRLYGEVLIPGSAELGRSEQLFANALKLSNNPGRAWELTLAGLFQEPRMLTY